MTAVNRRHFLSAAAGCGAAIFAGMPIANSPSLGGEEKTGNDSLELDTLFLTWQRDPTTTMTVQWIGPELADERAVVSYSAMDGEVWTVAMPRKRRYPKSELFVYRTELTGLAPGAEYRFRIGGDWTTHRFRTMPAKMTDAFQFVSGGDCGINPFAVANNKLAAKQDPMFALIGGDLGYDNGLSVHVSLQFVRNYSRYMIDSRGRLIPMVVCIGNHEVAGGYNAKREAGPFFFALHDGLFAERSYAALDFGDYLSLVLLDTGHVAKIDGEQTNWLDNALAERAGRPHVIAVNHVPAYPSHREYDSENKRGTGVLNRKHWVPLFEKHNVDLVLEHHDHTFKRTHPLKDSAIDAGGIVYLGDGSWGRIRPVTSPEKRPYLAVAESSFHLTLHRLEENQRFHLAMKDGGRIVDICTTKKRPQRRVGRGA